MHNYLNSSMRSCSGTVIGIIAAQILGLLWWSELGGPLVVLAGVLVASLLSVRFRMRGLSSSVTASVLGAFVASYCAVASAELVEPGTVEWALRGGIYGGIVGIICCLILSPLGWMIASKSVGVNE